MRVASGLGAWVLGKERFAHASAHDHLARVGGRYYASCVRGIRASMHIKVAERSVRIPNSAASCQFLPKAASMHTGLCYS